MQEHQSHSRCARTAWILLAGAPALLSTALLLASLAALAVLASADQGASTVPQFQYRENPRGDEPKLLLFSQMKPAYARDHAQLWGERGLNGCLFHIGDWSQDVWAVDGDSSTMGEADEYFQQVRAANEEGRKYGIDSNFITVAFYKLLPDWFDNVAWNAVCARYRQLALFARASGCPGVAIDMEYVKQQYHLDWEPYVEKGYAPADLIAKSRQRGAEVAAALMEEFPQGKVLLLPEAHHYERLAREFVAGMVEELARRDAPGGFHMLVESSYLETNWRFLASYPQYMEDTLKLYLSPAGWDYWRKRCSVAMGGWPLSYDHEVRDDAGNLVRWPGDKQPNLTVEQFRMQTAIFNMACRRYRWIFAYGSALWSFSPEQVKKYPGGGNEVLTTPDIDEYYQVMARGEVIADPQVEYVTDRVRRGEPVDYGRLYGSITCWWVVGPLDWPEGSDFHKPLIPAERFESGRQYQGRGGPVEWRQVAFAQALGLVDLRFVFGHQDFAAAYAVCGVESRQEREVVLRIGSDDDLIVWLNGEKVWEWLGTRGLTYDEDEIRVTLPTGESELMLKVGQRKGRWGFAVRITDGEGDPVPGVSVLKDSLQN